MVLILLVIVVWFCNYYHVWRGAQKDHWGWEWRWGWTAGVSWSCSIEQCWPITGTICSVNSSRADCICANRGHVISAIRRRELFWHDADMFSGLYTIALMCSSRLSGRAKHLSRLQNAHVASWNNAYLGRTTILLYIMDIFWGFCTGKIISRFILTYSFYIVIWASCYGGAHGKAWRLWGLRVAKWDIWKVCDGDKPGYCSLYRKWYSVPDSCMMLLDSTDILLLSNIDSLLLQVITVEMLVY